MNHVKSFGLKVYSDDLSNIPLSDPGKVLLTISPNSYGISTKDKEFRGALEKCDYLVLDGVYFALASILIHRVNIKRNQGPDVFRHFMQRMDQTGGRVFFMGSTLQVLEKIRSRAGTEYPNVTVEFHSPPFKPELDEEDDRIIIQKINRFKPDIVFVGMTCPKQEKWSVRIHKRLDAKLICAVGAVFDWYAERNEISPVWWKLRLAWLVRTIQRPEILRRYPNIFIFFWHLLLIVLRLKKEHP